MSDYNETVDTATSVERIELDDTQVEALTNNTLGIAQLIYDILMDSSYEDLVDVVENEDGNYILDDDFLEYLEAKLKDTSNRLKEDVFSESLIQSYFDTTSICAFVGAARNSIKAYRSTPINAQTTADDVLNAVFKLMEYIQSVAACLESMDRLDWNSPAFKDNSFLKEALEYIIDPETIDFIQHTKTYGLSYLDYNNISVLDATSESDDDSDSDSGNSSKDSGSLKAVAFDTANLRI